MAPPRSRSAWAGHPQRRDRQHPPTGPDPSHGAFGSAPGEGRGRARGSGPAIPRQAPSPVGRVGPRMSPASGGDRRRGGGAPVRRGGSVGAALSLARGRSAHHRLLAIAAPRPLARVATARTIIGWPIRPVGRSRPAPGATGPDGAAGSVLARGRLGGHGGAILTARRPASWLQRPRHRPSPATRGAALKALVARAGPAARGGREPTGSSSNPA